LARIILVVLVVVLAPSGARAQTPHAGTSFPPLILSPSVMDQRAQMPTSLNPIEVLDSAASALPSAINPNQPQTGERKGGLSAALNVMLLLTVITLAPAILLMCTCFVRIIIVLSLVRQALGTPQLPPPQVTTALALFATIVVMAPTVERIDAEALQPYRQGRISTYQELWDLGKQPIRDFMFAQIEATGNWSSVYMMLNYRGVDTSRPEALRRADVDMLALVPAFMLSELKTAFLLGFRVYLPFLVIDMVISTMLISMSMMMLPPVLISLPFKLLLFVLVDGWQLVVGSLMSSFAQPIASGARALLPGALPGFA
jgi:flagellar biosynthetic protein FliP